MLTCLASSSGHGTEQGWDNMIAFYDLKLMERRKRVEKTVNKYVSQISVPTCHSHVLKKKTCVLWEYKKDLKIWIRNGFTVSTFPLAFWVIVLPWPSLASSVQNHGLKHQSSKSARSHFHRPWLRAAMGRHDHVLRPEADGEKLERHGTGLDVWRVQRNVRGVADGR